MNPAKFQLEDDVHQQHSSRDIQILNGNRPSPLKINKGSYLIHKPSNSFSRMGMAANKMQEQQQQYHHHHYEQQRQPVIIYTQSPKVIHTQARDFMALVQKLTGLSPSPQHDDDHHQSTISHQTQHTDHDVTTDDHVNANDSSSHGRRTNHDDHIDNNNVTKSISGSHDENDQSSSGLTDENCGGNIYENENKNALRQGSSLSSAGYSPNTMFSHPSPYFADIPLFTPTSTSNSADFFCSPRPLYRFPDSSSHASPNVGGSMSPSMFKFIKGLPEY